MRAALPSSLVLALLAGCHTQQVGRADRAPQARVPPESREVHLDISSGRPVHATPGRFLSRNAVLEIQRALSAKGEPLHQTGKLDGATRAALKRFQKSQRQPDTGYPDFDTLGRLGLRPTELYGGKPDKETGAAGLEK